MKSKILYGLIVIGAFGSGAYFGSGMVEKESSKQKSEQEVKVVERVVEKIVTITEKPDGTKITRTEDKVADTKKDGTRSRIAVSKKQKPVYKPQWSVGLYTSAMGPSTYTASVHRRVLGSFWVGAMVSTDMHGDERASVGLRVEF